jgi:histidyl-tRNA synthetase
MEEAIERLVDVHELLEEAGYGDVLSFDFGLFQDLSYYSDLVFEAYAPGVGLPIASGGRYDGLLAHYDWDVPGVGFAIGLDRLEEALEEADAMPSSGPPVLTFVGGLERPAKAQELRRLGWRVACLPEDAATEARPCLIVRGAVFVVEAARGTGVSGTWREALKYLEQSGGRP